MKLYKYGSMPLEQVLTFKNGERYVTSSGDLLEWTEEVQMFNKVLESPLDLSQEENTMENLTEKQLKLFWKLCK